jgi:hypothetical protein
MVDCMTDLKSAAKHIEQIAENKELADEIRIKAHLLFGEFHSIINFRRGRRVTINTKRDLLVRMNELINTLLSANR